MVIAFIQFSEKEQEEKILHVCLTYVKSDNDYCLETIYYHEFYHVLITQILTMFLLA